MPFAETLEGRREGPGLPSREPAADVILGDDSGEGSVENEPKDEGISLVGRQCNDGAGGVGAKSLVLIIECVVSEGALWGMRDVVLESTCTHVLGRESSCRIMNLSSTICAS
jgi:hypothetical protein